MHNYMQDALTWTAQILNITTYLSGILQTQTAPWSPPYNLTSEVLADNCSHFSSKVNIPEITVQFTQYVPGGTNLSFPDNHPSCGIPYQVVSSDICRVVMSVQTSSTTEMSFEAWFPKDYTGRFLSTGNRGLSGCVLYDEMEYTTSLGFASVGANNGHNGTSGTSFLNNPEVIADYAYRALNKGAKVGKALTDLFYGYPLYKSYYLGCSGGGRQGFKEAQDFPEDFDGIVVGAPALAFTRIVSWGGSMYKKIGLSSSDTFLSPELWALVYDEVLQQCDGLDGAVDGLLEDSNLCQFVPEVLICTHGQKSRCLTGKQAETVRAIFSPLYGRDGQFLYPRMQPGINTKKEVPFYFEGRPFDLFVDWYRHAVFNDTTWDPDTFSLDDAATALAQNPFNIETWNGDLGKLHARGGKVLTYHGLQDYVVSSEISQLYYAHVASTMGLPPHELDKFYRLFSVSGMEHCRGGDGAFAIGQDSRSYAGKDPNQNVLMAMVRWVEEGIAPEVLRGAKLADDGVTPEYWRAHCKWPKRNRYVGPGNATEEDAWKCV